MFLVIDFSIFELIFGSHFVTRRKIFLSHKLFYSTLLNKKHSVSHNFFEDETFS
jgi:hypothetical protein